MIHDRISENLISDFSVMSNTMHKPMNQRFHLPNKFTNFDEHLSCGQIVPHCCAQLLAILNVIGEYQNALSLLHPLTVYAS